MSAYQRPLTAASKRRLQGLVLGNSHLACLKNAYSSARPAQLGFGLTFCGAPGQAMNALLYEDGRIFSHDLRLQSQWARLGMPLAHLITDYDFIAVFGWRVSIFRATALAHRLDIQPHSPEFTAEICHNLTQLPAYRILAQLHEMHPRLPLLLFPQPHPSELLRHDTEKFPNIHHILNAHQAEDYAAAFLAALKASFGQVATLIPQAPKTITAHLLTKAAYTTGSTRLASDAGRAHDGRDYLHSNTAYGHEALAQMVEHLRKEQAS